jgi:hypothetical protein
LKNGINEDEKLDQDRESETKLENWKTGNK